MQGKPRKAALAAWIGSALEYYDFFIYGTAAALVFNKLFFPSTSPATGTLLAVATFGVGYLARPVGAFVLGHIGDKFGRKRVLVATLVMMGGSTFLVGCLPTYDQVGLPAPILLVLLRLLQGLSVSGEQAGANSMTLEHAPENRRAYYTSFTLNGTQAGQIIATAIFLPIAALPEEQLLSWGWRVPFWLSVVVAAVGLVIRRTLEETPAFEREVATDTVATMPLAVLFRDQWRDVLRVVVAAVIASVSTIFTVHALSYAVNTMGLERTPMLWVGVLANVAAVISIPLWGRLSDRVGRKPIFIGGSLGCAVLMFAYLWSISVGNYFLIFVVGIVMFGIVHSATSGVWPAFYGEMFTTRVRLSGMAVGTQIGFAIAGFAPTVATAVSGTGPDSWLGVSIITAVVCLINVAAVATGRETYHVPTAQLGLKSAERVTV
ncbi:MHS family MFS transporter [Nonomuraea sp. KC401]|uniref:MFS transporter n=1 Tax=unclassified Nonomuraea TaxID=2593643 RepID=UPI0010FF1F5F|nr:MULTISPECIES: MFS transporter [unclassified Nonomuraea]NBE97942.1 MFS transporter [Nonomuraea sp. K271]TLF61957.1 MHS family MFS transporter [Nonomuraea sp. KC401]